jgi:D-arabinose 1-dehydrogenase-like Zn-dependent alcohol dehydrogenase
MSRQARGYWRLPHWYVDDLVDAVYQLNCWTDLHARLDDWPLHPKIPLVGGHEGVGIVVAIGKYTSQSPVKLGDRVGIKWLADSCLQCEMCRKGLEQSKWSHAQS